MTQEITCANRLNMVSEYYFSQKLKEVARLNAEGKDIINLGIGNPDIPPSQTTIDTLVNDVQKSDAHGYQPYAGISELRNAFADFYQHWFRVTLDPTTEILPLIGSKEGILHITLAFVNPGEQVLVPNPGYPTYTSLSNLLGAEVIPYDLNEETDWLPNFEALEQLDLSRVKLMWTNYPHMPTGKNGTLELYRKLVEFGRKHAITIVNDNPYSFILNKKPLSILQIPEAKNTCIEINSMSKSHNMPGWRMGVAVSNPTFISWILKVKSNIDSGMFRPLQLAATAALHNSDEWHELMNRKTYHKRRIIAEQIMDVLECSYDKTQVGLFLWGKISDRYTNAETLTEEILHRAQVFITPGFIFGSNGVRYIRLSLCSSEDDLLKALTRIRKIK